MNGVSPAPAGEREREFAFGSEDFDAIRLLVKQTTGINLTEAKRELVYGRLSRRLRALGLDGFRAYREYLLADERDEITEFCNAITTNLTSFFREAHHFDHLRDHLQRLAADPHTPSRRLRIWSAGCSTGEEAYSIAMTVAEAIPQWKRWDIRILATDLDSDVLAQARRGEYAADRVKQLDAPRLKRFFLAQSASGVPSYRVDRDIASMIAFKQLNLMHALPMRGPLDVIFCRNVIIYFDKDTQRELFARVAPLQRPGGLLYLGHSESLFRVSEDYSLLGKTIYRRIGS